MEVEPISMSINSKELGKLGTNKPGATATLIRDFFFKQRQEHGYKTALVSFPESFEK